MKKNAAAVALGKRSGRKRAEAMGSGGMAKMGRQGARSRKAALTPEERSEIARRAAEARWKKKPTR